MCLVFNISGHYCCVDASKYLLSFCQLLAKSIISYGLLIYGSAAAKTRLGKIERVQRLSIRAILFSEQNWIQ